MKTRKPMLAPSVGETVVDASGWMARSRVPPSPAVKKMVVVDALTGDVHLGVDGRPLEVGHDATEEAVGIGSHTIGDPLLVGLALKP